MRKFITLLIIVIGLISCSSDVDDKVGNQALLENGIEPEPMADLLFILRIHRPQQEVPTS